jgi:hypothetical protein
VVSRVETFIAVLAVEKSRVFVPLPFDPEEVWGRRERLHVTGTVNGIRVRGVIERFGPKDGVVLGPVWRRDCGLDVGDRVSVTLMPEGPQRGDLSPDIAEALDSEPDAGEFFDSLAQFYRNGYLTWIEATKRRPELRPQRIAEMVELLKAGQKQRPQPS